MKFPAFIVICVATFLVATPLANAGVPITGTEVGLEHDPGDIAAGPTATDSKGNVIFGKLAAGRYVVFLPDASKLKVPAIIVISGTKPITSVPILPGKADKAYALDNNGRRLTVTIDKAGGEFTITVTEAASR